MPENVFTQHRVFGIVIHLQIWKKNLITKCSPFLHLPGIIMSRERERGCVWERECLYQSTVNVRNPNVQSDKLKKILFILKSLGYPKRLKKPRTSSKPVWNWFVQFSEVRFDKPNQKKFDFWNPNDFATERLVKRLKSERSDFGRWL